MARDIQTTTKTTVALAPQQLTAGATGLTIDRLGAESLNFECFAGVVAAASSGNQFAVTLEHGDQSDMSDAAAVPADDVIADGVPGGTAGALDATSKANTVFARLGYRGTKRYVRPIVAETGTADAFVGILALQGHLKASPVGSTI